MLAVYCRDEAYRRRVERVLPGEYAFRLEAEWREFERAAARAPCSVAVIPWLATDPALERLALFRARRPLHPVVLVTRGDLENARALKDFIVDEVVWTQEMERELADAVGRACVLAETRSLVSSLRAAAGIPPRLLEALARACESERPIRTVERLALEAGCDRRTLWSEWREAVGDGEAERLRLQDFLHWLLLLRAAGRKTPSRSWAEVAAEVGVHPQTLGRLARQLAGCRLAELAAGGQSMLADRFAAEVLPRLRGDPGDKVGAIGQSAVG